VTPAPDMPDMTDMTGAVRLPRRAWRGTTAVLHASSRLGTVGTRRAASDALGIDAAILAGYSLAGAVAQEVWHRHPRGSPGWSACTRRRSAATIIRATAAFASSATQRAPGH